MKPKFENNKHECTLSISVSNFTSEKASFQKYCNDCLFAHLEHFFFFIVQFDFQARQKIIRTFSLHRNKRLSKHIYLPIITGVLISPAFNFLGSFGSAVEVSQVDRITTRTTT